MSEQSPPVLIQSFAIRPDNFIEVTYVETREQTERAGVIRTVVIDPELIRKEDLDDVMDTLNDWIDAGYRHIRGADE